MKPEYKVLTDPARDWRLTADRHTDSHLPVTRFSSKEEVDRRREELRFNLRMAAGLYPWPERNPLNVRTEDVGDYEGYSVKKIMFESRPGFWSTGNLYLPRPLTGKAPAILNVIGHWEEQRLNRSATGDYPQQIANFARMGFVCLVTDMIGKVDSRQITHDYGRDEKELWQSNGLGIQLWNNIRALDLLCAMPEVDPDRIGVTGASGGGSQTLFLALADDRVKAAAPINMISLEMQGGCQCENAPGLRRHTDNAEMCAMLAPRALFMAGSTGDWTQNQEVREYPMIRDVYRLYGAEDKAEHYFQVAEHQYNEKTRSRVYSFFARNLMGCDPGWAEQPIQVDDLMDLTWFRGDGHAPGIEGDEEFYSAHKRALAQGVATLDDDEKRRMLAWVTGVREQKFSTADGNFSMLGDITLEKNVITTGEGAQIPYIRLTPANWDGRRVCLALGGNGKECADGADIQKMLAEGVAVVSGDLFMTGESSGCKRKIVGSDNAARYFTTFHYTDDACRIQDVALLWEIARQTGAECRLWAAGTAARAAMCALPLLEGVQSARLEGDMLDMEDDQEYYKQFFVPGIMLLGGVSGCLKLAECPVSEF